MKTIRRNIFILGLLAAICGCSGPMPKSCESDLCSRQVAKVTAQERSSWKSEAGNNQSRPVGISEKVVAIVSSPGKSRKDSSAKVAAPEEGDQSDDSVQKSTDYTEIFKERIRRMKDGMREQHSSPDSQGSVATNEGYQSPGGDTGLKKAVQDVVGDLDYAPECDSTSTLLGKLKCQLTGE